MRLTGKIPKQSNSAAQIRPPPWLNLRRKPELDLLPLELDFLYGLIILGAPAFEGRADLSLLSNAGSRECVVYRDIKNDILLYCRCRVLSITDLASPPSFLLQNAVLHYNDPPLELDLKLV